MKLTLVKACLFWFMVLNGFVLKAQYHDFDSLLSHDTVFKALMEEAYDDWDMFSSSEVMRISLATDFKLLTRQKLKEEYQEAVIKYQLNDTVIVTRNVTVRPRGNARRKACFYPPLKVNFSKNEVFWQQLKEYDKLKMVVECRNSKWARQNLLSEYYAYKLYNLITDTSFRIRLLGITYTDTSGKLEPDNGYAFLIENIDLLAARNNAVNVSLGNIKDQATDHQNLANFYLFQYLIGNTDWSIKASHNIEFIKENDPFNTVLLAVPYDFDYAGIVDANYALPNETYDLESVRERMYLGTCIEESYIRQAIGRFKAVKKEVYALYENSLLEAQTKQRTLDYLDQFYRVIESEPALRQNILNNCQE